MLGSLGRKVRTFASVLFSNLRRCIDPGPRWLFALDDTPTQRYGPCVEGAGRHHNPTPGPAQQKFLNGHGWVTLAWMVHHPCYPCYPTLGLPLLVSLYVHQTDLERFPKDKSCPAFQTILEQAADQIRWLKEQLAGTAKKIWVVADGAYSKRPVIRVAHQEGVIMGRLRKDAALYSVPPMWAEGQRGPGRPPT